MIDPQKARRSNGCMAFKIIPCYILKSKRLIVKSENSKINNPHQRRYAEEINQQVKRISQKGSSLSMSLKPVITHTKGH